MNRERSLARATNVENLVKVGTKVLSGTEAVLMKNIDAVMDLSEIFISSYGPNGMKKMVIDRHGKLFVTKDTSTILNGLEIIHPAAKTLEGASKMQKKEVGDGTNYVLIIGGELLRQAIGLVRMGVHSSDIVQGYMIAMEETIKFLETQVVETITSTKGVEKALFAPISSKHFGFGKELVKIVKKACIAVLPKNPKNFNVDNVRTIKITGGTASQSRLVLGFVTKRIPEGSITTANDALVAVFSCGIESTNPETKGTVLLKTSEELLSYTHSEEELMKKKLDSLKELGIKVVISGNNISDVAQSFLTRLGIVALRIPSKFELLRIARAVKARILTKFETPSSKEDLGFVQSLNIEEIAETKLTILYTGGRVSTIILRGPTEPLLESAERAVDDAVNTYRALCLDGRILPGAGAIELAIENHITKFANQFPGVEQYSIKRFGEAFRIIPKRLLVNAGMRPDLISELVSKHTENSFIGVDIENEKIFNSVENGIFDLFYTKYWSIRLLVDAVITILRVDQIIFSKPDNSGIVPPQMGMQRDSD